MGYVPLPPMPQNAAQALAQQHRSLRREMKGRGSRWAWRRRRAYRACLTLIRMREAVYGFIDDPWIPRPPSKPTSEMQNELYWTRPKMEAQRY